MHKICSCGIQMNIQLSTIIYKRKLFIERVPTWNCSKCQGTDFLPFIKEQLLSIIKQWQLLPYNQHILFDECSENAKLIYRWIENYEEEKSLDTVIHQRINELLDEWILVESLHDEVWKNDIHRRLTQLSLINVC